MVAIFENLEYELSTLKYDKMNNVDGGYKKEKKEDQKLS